MPDTICWSAMDRPAGWHSFRLFKFSNFQHFPGGGFCGPQIAFGGRHGTSVEPGGLQTVICN